MEKDKYHMDLNYLAFYDGFVDRFSGSEDLVIYGSVGDAIDTESEETKKHLIVKKVSECSIELQEEYKKTVDKY